MINQSKVDTLIEFIAETIPCVECPLYNECTKIPPKGKDDCINFLKKWVSSI